MPLAPQANALMASTAPADANPTGAAAWSAPRAVQPSRWSDAGDLEALVVRYRAGEEDVFARLVERCADRLFNFLLRFTGNVQDAEDLAQETFLKAYRGLDRFETSRSFLPWLFTIARRTALNHLRARRPSVELPDDLPAPEPTGGATETLAARDDNDLLWRLARRLKPKYYQALWLRYGEGFNVSETATVMGTSSIHVKVLLHRGRHALLGLARRAGFDNLRSNP